MWTAEQWTELGRWARPAATLFAIVAVVWMFISLLRWLQRAFATARSERAAERTYLQALVHFTRELHLHSSFDEQFFIAREFSVRNRYQPRSFFVSSRSTILSRVASVAAGAQVEESGRYTRDLLGEALSSQTGGPLIILGEPGSGKSVSARQLVIDAARRLLETKAPDGRLPVLVTLRDYADWQGGRPVAFYEFLRSVIGEGKPAEAMPSRFLAERFDDLLDAGRLLFVIDGLDEMPPHGFQQRCAELNLFMLRHATNRFVITCRSTEFAGQIQGREAYLDRLTPSEVRSIIRKRRHTLAGEGHRAVYRQLTTPAFPLAPLISNPFYLNLILYYRSMTGELPENIPFLLHAVCHDWAAREVRKRTTFQATPEMLLDSLGRIAFTISDSIGFGSYIEIDAAAALLTSHGLAKDAAEEVLQIAMTGSMLERDGSGARARFVHHKIQEYFAAENLNRLLARGSLSFDALPSICRNIWWNEVVAILAGIANEPSRIIDTLLSGALSNDEEGLVLPLNGFWLAGRCMRLVPEGAEKNETMRKVLGFMQHILEDDEHYATHDRLDAIRAVSELDAPEAVEVLAELLRSSSRIERELALSGLTRTAAGRAYLAANANRIGRDVYIRRLYGTSAGRHANNIRTTPFGSFRAALILSCWRAADAVRGAQRPILTILFCALAGRVLLQNVYTAMIATLLVVMDLATPRLHWLFSVGGKTRGKVVRRIILLLVLTLFVALGWMRPPYLIAPFLFLAIVITFWCWEMIVAGALVSVAFKRAPGGVRRRKAAATKAWRRFAKPRFETIWTYMGAILAFLRGKEERLFALVAVKYNPFDMDDVLAHGPDTLADHLLRTGQIDVTTYARRFASDPVTFERLVEELPEKDLGGQELEVLDFLENVERRARQATTIPTLGVAPIHVDSIAGPPALPGAKITGGRSYEHVFISYSRENRPEVEKLCGDLAAAGERVWFDVHLLPGQDWQAEIRRAINAAYAVILCFSKESAARVSSGMYPEADQAIAEYRRLRPGSIYLIPVRLSECEIPPLELGSSGTISRLQSVDLFPDSQRDAAVERLVKALRSAPLHP